MVIEFWSAIEKAERSCGPHPVISAAGQQDSELALTRWCSPSLEIRAEQ